MSETPAILAEGFGYLEAARWHDGALYFSDIGHRKVFRMSLDGSHEALFTLAARPSGIGWTPDGEMLVIGMEDNTLNTVGKSGQVIARRELAGLVKYANDMVVDDSGRAYVSQFGYDLFNHAPPEPTGVITIAPDGQISQFGEGLIFPNGIGITPDGKTLVVAESFGFRLSAFDIATDGSLSNQRIFADFGGNQNAVTDGLCIDAEGAVWIGMPFAGEFWRVRDGGEITNRIKPKGRYSYCVDCALGGDDGRTLFLLCADTNVERMADNWDSEASVQAISVEIPAP
ncbi:MAG: SMP-30/gluconolactonase/LRE family protein [Novosphingobium sp.]|nr:SMP-30/gluconolactonase/LRE family protein [Novosphingobium sp.]